MEIVEKCVRHRRGERGNLKLEISLQGFLEKWKDLENKTERDIGCWANKETWVKKFKALELELVASKSDGFQFTWFLVRKAAQDALTGNQTVVDVSKLDCDWLMELKEKMSANQKRPKGENLWLVSSGQPYSGIVGMVKCLVKEPGGGKVR